MRCAIIGGGFAGIALAWKLISLFYEVTLFDATEIGESTSGLATGLLHPYVAKEGKRSLYATEAIAEALKLIEVAEQVAKKPLADRSGIIRLISKDQEELFLEHKRKYQDISLTGNQALILSGLTVDCRSYLKNLWKACTLKGARLHKTAIHHLDECKEFDQIFITAGMGCLSFFPEMPLERVKGQLLILKNPLDIAHSLMKDGHVTSSKVGSTYERGFLHSHGDLEEAKALILPKISSFFPEVNDLEFSDCKAGIRVCRKGNYLPFVAKINPKTWVFTGLGSRGLLYHGYFADQIAAKVMSHYNDQHL